VYLELPRVTKGAKDTKLPRCLSKTPASRPNFLGDIWVSLGNIYRSKARGGSGSNHQDRFARPNLAVHGSGHSLLNNSLEFIVSKGNRGRARVVGERHLLNFFCLLGKVSMSSMW
jgi:hypothetical protein